MSQEDILTFLKESPRTFYSCKDISTYLECGCSRISHQLKQLRKYEWIEFKKESDAYKACWLYRHKKIKKK